MAAAVARSHPGRVRPGNEDSYILEPELSLFAVADGMGGHNGGEVASHITVQTLTEFIRTSTQDSGITWPYGFNTQLTFEANQLKSGVQLANQQIRYQAQRQPEYDGMGSTLIAVMVRDSRAVFVNVGDSRLYLWRNGALRQLSEDDSWAASMIRAGAPPASIEHHEMRHMLTRALGSGPTLDVTIGQVSLEPGDILLMCSDGLYGPLGDDGIARVLRESDADLDRAVSALIEAANDAGGPDNITTLLVRAPDGVSSKVTRRLAEEKGQTLVEYIVTAGVLVALGIVISGILTNAFRIFVLNVMHEVSFPSV
ncbi:MAG: protein phosphatase 2C domain-containing protein [Acidobacteria bacterium]|nr:protein phosphatase 2C domain-containing protein [Acidobacteriota bacterium]